MATPAACTVEAPRAMSTLADHPALVAQIDQERNPINPALIPAKARLALWWRCPHGPDHTWQAVVYSRTAGNGCPFCAGKRVCPSNSLLAVAPQLAAQWHPTRNAPLTPSEVTCGSDRKVWWRCPTSPEHEWQAAISSRSRGVGCPFCSGRRASSTNSLASSAPDVAAQWHPTKNEPLTPETTARGSTRRVWWKCPLGADHVWQASVVERVSRGKGCPFCAGHQVSSSTSLAHVMPQVAAEWHPTRNGPLTPRDVTAGSARVVWWRCKKDAGHEWQCRIDNRTRLARGCPFCAGQKVTPDGSLGALYPELVRQWHEEKNHPRTPHEVGPSSRLAVFWRCPRGADHEWKAAVYTRTVPGGGGCPFCSGHRVSKDNCLATRFPRVAQDWHPTRNGTLTPAAVTWGSGKRVWWRCQLGHVWKAAIRDRTREDARGCPACAKGRHRPVATTARRRSAARMPEYEGPRHGPVIRRGS